MFFSDPKCLKLLLWHSALQNHVYTVSDIKWIKKKHFKNVIHLRNTTVWIVIIKPLRIEFILPSIWNDSKELVPVRLKFQLLLSVPFRIICILFPTSSGSKRHDWRPSELCSYCYQFVNLKGIMNAFQDHIHTAFDLKQLTPTLKMPFRIEFVLLSISNHSNRNY